jgi:hypothetical protein
MDEPRLSLPPKHYFRQSVIGNLFKGLEASLHRLASIAATLSQGQQRLLRVCTYLPATSPRA